MAKKENEMYVLTDDNTNALYGVYSSMMNATIAMWNIAAGCLIVECERQNIGTRFVCYNKETDREYRFYVEIVEVDGEFLGE